MEQINSKILKRNLFESLKFWDWDRRPLSVQQDKGDKQHSDKATVHWFEGNKVQKSLNGPQSNWELLV